MKQTINFKWLWVLLLLGIAYAGINYELQNMVILPSFLDLERLEAEKNMARCLDSIDREIDHLKKIAKDWAKWDDTYQFVQDSNPEFIDSNMEWETLENDSDINLIYILSQSGKVVWGEAYSSKLGGIISMVEFSCDSLSRDHYLVHQVVGNPLKTGIILTERGPMIIASIPILKSSGKGPAMGTFIMGRFITKEMLRLLAQQTRVNFTAKDIKKDSFLDAEQAIITRLAKSPSVIEINDENHLFVYGIHSDIDGKPALFIKADLSREIMQKGKSAALFASVSVLITLTFIAILLFFAIVIYITSMKRRTARIETLVEERTKDLKRANENAEQARADAEEASKAKSQFLANMSHEIRTPLSGIIGMADIAMGTIANENQRDIFDTINREARSLLGIINNILDFSKIEAGKTELEIIPFNLRLLLEDVGNSIAFLAEQKGIECITLISPDFPDEVRGDAGRIRQILMNLAGNALKFTQKGGLIIRGRAEADSGDMALVRLSVEDTGIGIEKEKIATIFESFTQADGSTTRKYGGTGLGISISKELVELMEGELRVESEVGKGSIFWFTLKLAHQVADIRSTQVTELKNFSVLVVGRDDTIASPRLKILKESGYRVELIENGKQTLSFLRNREFANGLPALFLIDFQLPDTDGFTLAAEIRKSEAFKAVPILLITHTGNIGDGRLCSDIGIDGYLVAPFERHELQSIIQMLLGQPQEQRIAGAKTLVTRYTIAETKRKNIRILLVDDYPTNRKVALCHLQRAGFQVDVATNGEEAVKAFRQKIYDLVFMDVQMPVMDGYDATRKIRNFGAEGEKKKRVPVIAMTANTLKGDREKCLSAGMDDYITKPILRESLLDTVFQWTAAKKPACEFLDENKAKTQDTENESKKNRLFLDFDRVLKDFGGEKTLVLKILNYFLEQGYSQITIIQEAILNKRKDIIRAEAHKIKGGAANLTMDRLSHAAISIETAVKADNFNEADGILKQIEREFQDLASFIETQ